MAKIVLIGAGGHAKVVLDCLGGKAYGFVDDSVDQFFGLKKLHEIGDKTAIIGFGAVTTKSLERRHKIFKDYAKLATAIHKSAIISKHVEIGEGTMIGPGVIINSGARIGRNVIINSGAVIEHDAVIGDGSHVAPRAVVLGGAKIGECAMIGAGAVVLPGVEVKASALVKALSVK